MDNPCDLRVLRLTTPGELGPKRLKALRKVLEEDPNGRTMDHVISEVNKKFSFILSWENLHGTGILVVQVLDRGPCKELFIDLLGGTGYLKLLPWIVEDLKDLARVSDCSMLGAMVTRPGLAKVFKERVGWEEVGTYGMVKVN